MKTLLINSFSRNALKLSLYNQITIVLNGFPVESVNVNLNGSNCGTKINETKNDASY